MIKKDVVTAVSDVVWKCKNIDVLIFYLKIEKGMTISDISRIVDLPNDDVHESLKAMYERIKKEFESRGICSY